MPDRYKKDVGQLGEDAANAYLRKKRYRIINRNYYMRGGELDIIAEKRGVTVFIEVKTRTSDEYGAPAEAVTYRKMERMKKAAAFYMMQKGLCYARFDIIEVYADFDGKKFKTEKINHIENAFV